MLKVVLGIFVYFILLQSAFSNECSNLFESHKNSIRQDLNRILLSDFVVAKIDSIRRHYTNAIPQIKALATVEIHRVIREIENIPERRSRNENEKVVLDMGINNLIDDLVNISPQYLSTHRILNENIAVMMALISLESTKIIVERGGKDGGIISLTPERLQTNSEYVTARREVFNMIEAYRGLDYIPREVKSERVGELLLADQRYQYLSQDSRETLLFKIMQSLVARHGEGVETLADRFYVKNRRKAN